MKHRPVLRFASVLLLAAALVWPGVATAKAKRSRAARGEFKNEHPCPATGKKSGACPGYTIDHIKPLKRGGADAPSNMQWQTKADAKAKDKRE